MRNTREYLKTIGLPSGDALDLPTSGVRFPDGAQYRVEIPSVEGPRSYYPDAQTSPRGAPDLGIPVVKSR